MDIDEELNKKLRSKMIDVKGSKKGALQETIIEAIKLWLAEE